MLMLLPPKILLARIWRLQPQTSQTSQRAGEINTIQQIRLSSPERTSFFYSSGVTNGTMHNTGRV